MKSENTIKFLNALQENREVMNTERLGMTELQFANKWKVSPTTVTNHMGFITKENIKKVILDPVEINILRLTMTDDEIRINFSTSVQNINSQCGTRKFNKIPKFTGKRKVRIEPKVIPSDRMDTKHPKIVGDEYWKNNSGEIIDGMKALPYTYTRIVHNTGTIKPL